MDEMGSKAGQGLARQERNAELYGAYIMSWSAATRFERILRECLLFCEVFGFIIPRKGNRRSR